MSDFANHQANVVSLKGDSTEFRVWADRGVVSTDDVYSRCVTMFGPNGSKMSLAPEFRRLDDKASYKLNSMESVTCWLLSPTFVHVLGIVSFYGSFLGALNM